MTKQESYWHNYVTGEYDYREFPTSFDDARAYIPQIPAAQGLFQVYEKMELPLLEAMTKTLEACVGKRAGEPA